MYNNQTVNPLLSNLYSKAISEAAASETTVEDILSTKWFCKQLEGATFTYGAYQITVDKIGQFKCIIIESAFGIEYKHPNRTTDILFDYVNRRLNTFQILSKTTVQQSTVETDEFTIQQRNHQGEIETLQDFISTKCDVEYEAVDVTNKYVQVNFNEHIITVRRSNNPLELPSIMLLSEPLKTVSTVSDIKAINIIAELTKHLHYCQEAFSTINKLDAHIARLYEATQTLPSFGDAELRNSIRDFIVNDTDTDDKLHIAINSLNGQQRTMFFHKQSKKLYSVDVYSTYDDGKEYYEHYTTFTSANKKLASIIEHIISVKNAYKGANE